MRLRYAPDLYNKKAILNQSGFSGVSFLNFAQIKEITIPAKLFLLPKINIAFRKRMT